MSGKLTIQNWQEQQEREIERQKKRDENLGELSREIASLMVPYGRRRKRSLMQRLVRAMSFKG